MVAGGGGAARSAVTGPYLDMWSCSPQLYLHIVGERHRSNKRQECCYALGEFQVLSPETAGVRLEL